MDLARIECEQIHPTLSVEDVRAAAEFYRDKLGFVIAFVEGDPASFAGVNLGKVQLFLSKGIPAPDGCSVYFVVNDADSLHEFHRANGVAILEGPRNQPYCLREYTVRDMATISSSAIVSPTRLIRLNLIRKPGRRST